jgi:hypothetical protein
MEKAGSSKKPAHEATAGRDRAERKKRILAVRRAKRAGAGLQGRRFTDDQRKQALVLVAGGMDSGEVAEAIGTTTESQMTTDA